jgi:hypothetical protein
MAKRPRHTGGVQEVPPQLSKSCAVVQESEKEKQKTQRE